MAEPGGKRRYVRVRCEIFEDGSVTPLAVLWSPGVTYEITKVARVESWSCLGTGRGKRYTIWVGGHQTFLYWDTNRWYVHERQWMPRQEGVAPNGRLRPQGASQ